MNANISLQNEVIFNFFINVFGVRDSTYIKIMWVVIWS
jgi:hypothetical protein